MEADSTTYDSNTKTLEKEGSLPFTTCPGNLKLYQNFMKIDDGKSPDLQIIEKMQTFGLIPSSMKCPSDRPDCNVVCRSARVVDRLQWFCQSCGKRQSIREGSFFQRLQCTIQQVLQVALAWSEDADLNVTAEHFGIKLKIVNQIFEKLDDLAIKEFKKQLLGGDNCVVLAEMYPDCMTRLSPDTTDHPHAHRILMLADTNHIPTKYQLHILKEESKKNLIDPAITNEMFKQQIEDIILQSIKPGSMIVTGNNVPTIDGAVSVQHLTQHCDLDMQHFLTTRIWRQAITVCSASRDMCGPAALPALCAGAVQRNLYTALYRLQYGDGFYEHILRVVVNEYTILNNAVIRESFTGDFENMC